MPTVQRIREGIVWVFLTLLLHVGKFLFMLLPKRVKLSSFAAESLMQYFWLLFYVYILSNPPSSYRTLGAGNTINRGIRSHQSCGQKNPISPYLCPSLLHQCHT